MTSPPTLADPGELIVSCLDCHHNATMPVTALVPRYAAETPFPEVWGGFRCLACSRAAYDVLSFRVGSLMLGVAFWCVNFVGFGFWRVSFCATCGTKR
jgi:hypothetical protein